MSGIGSPPWDQSFHDLTPNITGGIRERLRTGHRPGTDSLPVGLCLDPSQSSPHTDHASADFTPGSGVDSTHWSRLHSPAGGDEFASAAAGQRSVQTTWRDGGQQHRVEGRGDGRRASRGQVSQPRPARGRRGGLDGGGRTFFVVRKRPEGAAVKYWRSSQDTQLHV